MENGDITIRILDVLLEEEQRHLNLNSKNRIIKDAEISIFPDNIPLLAECHGLVGMQYFQDTIIVLDFERDLM